MGEREGRCGTKNRVARYGLLQKPRVDRNSQIPSISYLLSHTCAPYRVTNAFTQYTDSVATPYRYKRGGPAPDNLHSLHVSCPASDSWASSSGDGMGGCVHDALAEKGYRAPSESARVQAPGSDAT